MAAAPKAPLPTELIERAEGAEQWLVQTAELQVTAGPDRGKRCAIHRGLVTVGSDEACELVLSDPAVSRRQLELQATADGFLLRDIGSTNGTFIGKLRVQQALLHDAAVIEVGRTRIRFTPGGEHERYPLSSRHRFGAMLGQSPLMRHCFTLLERAAETSFTVLIEGESGTGKELAARAIHGCSDRGEGPFVVVDCGAIPASLIESELLGHEKGAFTGAAEARVGAFERADGGTLFLDEIGELDLAMQPKLLRFLERREIHRVGSSAERVVDVRVVAATNRRLSDLVAGGRFREDLFYRLAVLRVALPPLRQRREDVPLIALELARRLRPDADAGSWLDEHTLAVLGSYHWPGNVRELRNVIERLAVLPELSAEVLLGDAPPQAAADQAVALPALAQLPYHEAKERLLDAFERRYVAALLELEHGVVARAAARADVPRQTFFRLIRKHGLRADG